MCLLSHYYISWDSGAVFDLRSLIPKVVSYNSVLEFLWNVAPMLCLSTIIGPSFTLLYLMEDGVDFMYGIRVIGNQWYWSYELMQVRFIDIFEDVSEETLWWFDNCEVIEDAHEWFNSFLFNEKQLKSTGVGYRMLEVDARLRILRCIGVSFLVSSMDVLHSWALPSLGLKTDACPGRLSKILVWPNRQGVYYGQCSEICGINHAFMPITCNVH